MKLNSPLFDSIRVKPGQDRRPRKADEPCCEWKGCGNSATHRAPKGRMRENEYWRFCLDHVREYNASYNYFAGMNDDDVMRYQKDAITGHRPTCELAAARRASERAHAHGAQCRAQGAARARARGRRRQGRDQGSLQAAG